MLVDIGKIDENVRKKFRLFRSADNYDKDLEFYLNVYLTLFDEMLIFAEENLDKKRMEMVTNIVSGYKRKYTDKQVELTILTVTYTTILGVVGLDKTLMQIMTIRLGHCIDQLYIKWLDDVDVKIEQKEKNTSE